MWLLALHRLHRILIGSRINLFKMLSRNEQLLRREGKHRHAIHGGEICEIQRSRTTAVTT